MCTYCNTKNYRKIYENHNGIIPKEENGRTYEIHHLDGDHTNNNPTNLTAVTLQEHYDIHYAQGDWGACYLMSVQRLNKSPEEISELASKYAKHRTLEGTHHWLGGEIQREFNNQRVKDGTHPFLGGEIQRKSNQERLLNGTHHMIQLNNPSKKRVDNGTHTWLKREDGTSVSSNRVKEGTHNFLGPESNLKRVENGTHPFMRRPDGSSYQLDKVKKGTHHLLGGKITKKQLEDGSHSSCIKISCVFCKKTVSSSMFSRWHGDKCRAK
jgi:uncharacterized protein YifN (PemK superfamily)